MKKTFIKRLAAFILFAITSANLFSQGFYVYTKDGQRQDFPSENVDSIVFYEKATEEIGSNFINGHEYVDLGLPSGIKWATCNVGASNPEDYGGYYAWGETEEKNDYTEFTYQYARDLDGDGNYFDDEDNWINIGSNISSTQYDVAHVKWGGSWRMPTLDEITELVHYCASKWTTYNGVNGQLVTGPNGNSIFLPVAGRRDGAGFYHRGSDGHYWSATLGESGSYYAVDLSFYVGNGGWGYYWNRYYGHTVRPVTE